MDKLEKLAKWRLSPSSIEFPKDSRESIGGYATVSRAVLTYIHGSANGASKLNDSRNEVADPRCRALKSNDHVLNAEGDDGCQKAEGNIETNTDRDKTTIEKQKQGCGSKTWEGRKVGSNQPRESSFLRRIAERPLNSNAPACSSKEDANIGR